MPDIAQAVYALLSALNARVCYQFPQSSAALPCLVFYESGSQVAARADSLPHLHEVTFTVEAWALSPAAARALAISADAAMTGQGFIRVYAADLWDAETRACRRVSRYRALCDESGTLTQ